MLPKTLALLLLSLNGLVIGEENPVDIVNADIELSRVFDPRDRNSGYMRRYTIDVAHKSEECFFLPDVQENQILNYHFMVIYDGIYQVTILSELSLI
jgi:hypothetical protein